MACGVGRRAQDEPDDRVLLPVRDRVVHSLLVRHGRVDLVRHLSAGPAELAPGEDDALLEALAPHGGGRGLDLLDAAEVDVSLEHGPTVDNGVLDGLGPERQARDDCGADLRRAELLGILGRRAGALAGGALLGGALPRAAP
jgi:hypothetical protein